METEEKFKLLLGKARHAVLSQNEKEGIRHNLVNFMKLNPPPQRALFPVVWAPPSSWGGWIARQLARRRASTASLAVVCVAVLGFATVSYAAQGALPGDVLYPIKTGNENVLGMLIISDQQKAQYDINLTDLRLGEIEKLAARHALDSARASQVVKLLNRHISDLQLREENVKNQSMPDEAIAINSELQAQLRAHAQVLGDLAAGGYVNSSDAVNAVMTALQGNLEKSKSLQQSEEETLSRLPPSQGTQASQAKLREAQSALKKTSDLVEQSKGAVPDPAYQRAADTLQDASNGIEHGKEQLDANNFSGAFGELQDSLGKLQELQIYVGDESGLGVKIIPPSGQPSDKNLEKGLDF